MRQLHRASVPADTKVTAGEITVDLRTVTSDQSRRDDYFTANIMETTRYPNAVFTLTQPVDLGAEFASGAPVTAVRDGDTIDVSGAVPVTFTDFGIEPPNFGNVVRVDPTGQIEFLLTLSPTS